MIEEEENPCIVCKHMKKSGKGIDDAGESLIISKTEPFIICKPCFSYFRNKDTKYN